MFFLLFIILQFYNYFPHSYWIRRFKKNQRKSLHLAAMQKITRRFLAVTSQVSFNHLTQIFSICYHMNKERLMKHSICSPPNIGLKSKVHKTFITVFYTFNLRCVTCWRTIFHIHAECEDLNENLCIWLGCKKIQNNRTRMLNKKYLILELKTLNFMRWTIR